MLQKMSSKYGHKPNSQDGKFNLVQMIVDEAFESMVYFKSDRQDDIMFAFTVPYLVKVWSLRFGKLIEMISTDRSQELTQTL